MARSPGIFIYTFFEIIENIYKVYLTRLHITEEAYHGREYEGNECKKVQNKIFIKYILDMTPFILINGLFFYIVRYKYYIK